MTHIDSTTLNETEAKAARAGAGYIVDLAERHNRISHDEAIKLCKDLAREHPGVEFGVFALERTYMTRSDD